MQALTLLRIQAHANRLANLRLHTAMAALSHADLHATRTSFFPTLMATLNHILRVDLYYIDVLHGDGLARETALGFLPDDTLAALAERQRASDERLLCWLAAADAAVLDRTVHLPRPQGRIQRDASAHMLQHLLMHQTHHRGQAHAMLSGTTVPPPPLDEFLCSRTEAALLQAAGQGHQALEPPGRQGLPARRGCSPPRQAQTHRGPAASACIAEA